MGVTTTQTNKPLNPRGNDQSPLAYNRAKLFSGKALDFDGVNDTLSTDYAPSSNIQTTAYWVKLDSLSTNYTLGGFVGSSDQFGLYYWGGNANKNFGFNTWNADSYGVTLPDFVDDYFHVVAEYNFTDFTQSKLFVNGQELSISQTHGTTLQRTTASRTFKIDSPNSTQEMNGKISGVKVFEGSLTAAQVADLYNNPEKVVPTGVADSALKLWLPMQEGAGTTAYDGSGNGNHGTISGATYTHGIGAPVSQTAVIDWNKGTNILANTDIFDGYWTKSGGTLTTGIEAPDGTNTAFKFERDDASLGTIYKVEPFGLSGTNYRYVYAKLPSGSASASAQLLSHNTNTNNTFTITDEWQRFELNSSPLIPLNFYIVDFRGGVGVDEIHLWAPQAAAGTDESVFVPTIGTAQSSEVLLPQGLTSGRDITGVNLFENVRKQGALNLDGNSRCLVHDNASLDYTSAATLESWVYWTGEGDQGILGRWFGPDNQKSFMLYASDSDSVRVYYSNDGTASNNKEASQSLSAGNWYHFVTTYDGATIKIYVNAVEGNSAAYSSDIYVTTKHVDIGTYQEDLTKAYNGQLAQPRIYNRALTAEEVQRNYNAGKNIYTND